MLFEALVIFSTVIFSGHEASVAIANNCKSNEVPCGDGRCVRQYKDCLIILPKPIPNNLNQKSCVLPQYPKNGIYYVVPSESELTSNGMKYGRHLRIDFACVPGYTLVGKQSSTCFDGVWQDEFPQCVTDKRGCELNQLPKFSKRCTRHNGHYAVCSRFVFTYQCLWAYCGEYVPEGTHVRVSLEGEGYGGTAPPVTAEITCTSDGIFHISTRCVEEIDEMQHVFENISIRKSPHEYSGTFRSPSPKFEDLADSFESFQRDIMLKINKMQWMIKECDIRLELLSGYFDHKKPGQHNECDLPLHPENGQWRVVRSELGVLVLQYECKPGFALVGAAAPRCINGVWKDDFPHCSAACKLEKKAKFNYQCETAANNGPCQEYVAVGSVVKVSRRQETNTTVTAAIVCLENGTFNISTTCVQELDRLQKDFDAPTMAKMVDYESKFIGMDAKTEGPEFQRLVEDFHSFEQHVDGTLKKMHQKAAECDIYLDLLLSN